MWIRPACQALSEALDISSATAQIALGLLKALVILSDKTVRRSAADREDLKPYWKSEKMPNFNRWSTRLLSIRFSNTFLNTGRKLTGQ